MAEVDLLACRQSHELRHVERFLLANAGRSPREVQLRASLREKIREGLQRDIEQIERLKAGIADQYSDDLR